MVWRAHFSDILSAVASHPGGTEHGLRRILEEGTSKQRASLARVMAALPEPDVALMRGDPRVTRFVHGEAGIEEGARLAVATRLGHNEIQQHRLALLRDAQKASRPAPYNEAGFSDLDLDSDGMVGLREFSEAGDLVHKTGYVGQVLSTTGQGNDTYWLRPALHRLGCSDATLVRLDPFIHGRATEFPFMMYKMDVYGQPLDWGRLGGLVEAEHGQMYNERPLGMQVRTDYVWDPRGSELHFIAEEVPHGASGALSACRYLHAIYDRQLEVMTHFDGALRIVDEGQLAQRQSQHVRTAGKVGTRVKVFRVDAEVDRDQFATVAQSFFLWNHDLTRYFDGGAEASAAVN